MEQPTTTLVAGADIDAIYAGRKRETQALLLQLAEEYSRLAVPFDEPLTDEALKAGQRLRGAIEVYRIAFSIAEPTHRLLAHYRRTAREQLSR